MKKKFISMVPLEPYNHYLIVCLNVNNADIKKFLLKNIEKDYLKTLDLDKELKDISTDVEGVAGFICTDFLSQSNFFLRIDNFENSPEFLSYLTHELLHVVCHLFRKVGIPLSETSEEAYTYLIANLVNNILSQYENQ